MLFGNLFGVQSGLPSKLSERYVAGDISAAKVAIIDVSGMLLGELGRPHPEADPPGA